MLRSLVGSEMCIRDRSKYGMSMCVVGHAEEFKVDKIAVNGLWPRTTIATAAVSNLLGGDALMKMSRTPQIMAGAAHCVLTRRSDLCTGNLFLDDEVLASEGRGGEEALSKYAYKAGAPLVPDLYLSLIHISEPTRLLSISYAVFCLKKKKKDK
eukprot:TRINITY_DN8946_c0_g1_i6.p1 TRINITY_DN8946_c0_g1~~TRINITY_DN8946_c0_g1_i6.p1  ORF type:complete len:154 (-),score=60.11 TRINITY_DN8946_c0_g1_i6:124-585(-)